MLGHGLWLRALGGHPLVIGQQLSLEGGPPSTIVGVMPPGFAFPENTELWSSIDVAVMPQAVHTRNTFDVIARLRGEATVEQLRGELNTIAASTSSSGDSSARIVVQPLLESIVGSYGLLLLVLYLTATSVLLIGCANVVNLLLTRSIRRRRELTVRAALGAGRWPLVRLLSAEAVLLAALGGLAGWSLATMLLPAFSATTGALVPRLAEAQLDPVALAYCAGSAVVTAMITGLLPALPSSRVDLQAALLADGERTGPSAHQSRLQTVVSGAQIAICLVVLVIALMLAQTFLRLSDIELGFSPARVIAIDVRAPIFTTVRERRWHALATTTRRLEERLRSVPGVTSVAVSTTVPLDAPPFEASVTALESGRSDEAAVRLVGPGFFRTLGLPILAGRDFAPTDRATPEQLVDVTSPPRDGVAIVNATLSARLWPTGTAVGQYITSGIDRVTTSRRQVVGMVADIRSDSLLDPPRAELYVPLAEEPSAAMVLLVRTPLTAGELLPTLQREIRAIDSSLGAANVRTLDDIVRASMGPIVVGAPVVSALAILGVFLAAIGIYGVCAFAVAGRAREIAIRLALGATSRAIATLFLTQALKPIGLGLLAGLAAMLLLRSSIEGFLPGVSADWRSLIVSSLFVAAVGLTASYVPVRRALRVDPAVTLRR
jgi:predicted permease